jgi:hypothetical protein
MSNRCRERLGLTVLWVWLVRRRDKKGRKEDEAGKASRWNTLRALRVLDWYQN